MSTEQTSGVSISLLCSLSGYTHQAYYKQRHHKANSKLQEELVIQQVNACREVQKVIGTRKLHWLLFPFYREHGIRMGRDALFDLLRFHSLLIGKRRHYKPKTTDSNHWMKKYPNLIKDTMPIASGGLLVTDITYINVSSG